MVSSRKSIKKLFDSPVKTSLIGEITTINPGKFKNLKRNGRFRRNRKSKNIIKIKRKKINKRVIFM